jgi:hypothetical protein
MALGDFAGVNTPGYGSAAGAFVPGRNGGMVPRNHPDAMPGAPMAMDPGAQTPMTTGGAPPQAMTPMTATPMQAPPPEWASPPPQAPMQAPPVEQGQMPAGPDFANQPPAVEVPEPGDPGYVPPQQYADASPEMMKRSQDLAAPGQMGTLAGPGNYGEGSGGLGGPGFMGRAIDPSRNMQPMGNTGFGGTLGSMMGGSIARVPATAGAGQQGGMLADLMTRKRKPPQFGGPIAGMGAQPSGNSNSGVMKMWGS